MVGRAHIPKERRQTLSLNKKQDLLQVGLNIEPIGWKSPSIVNSAGEAKQKFLFQLLNKTGSTSGQEIIKYPPAAIPASHR